jgi:hypothetical protein
MMKNLTQITTSSGRWYEDLDELDPKPYYSVSTILDKTKPFADRYGLEKWVRDVGAGEAERIRAESSALGTEVHRLIEDYLLRKVIDSTDIRALDMLDAYVVGYINEHKLEVLHLEEMVYNEINGLRYAGSVDAILVENGLKTLVDHKTIKTIKGCSRRVKGYSLQVAGYAMAIENSLGIKLDQVRINFVAPDGFRSYLIDIDEYKPKFISRLEEFYKKGYDVDIQKDQEQTNNNSSSGEETAGSQQDDSVPLPQGREGLNDLE